MEQSHSWEANWPSAVKKFPALCGTRKFITEFTSARHLSLSWARTIHSMPRHPTFWRAILLLRSHQLPLLPSSLLSSRLPTKTLCALLSPIRATCPAHLTVLNLITRVLFGEQYRSLSFSLCSLHPPVTSHLWGRNTKQTIHRTTQQFWKSAGRAPSWLVIPWHLPYNRGKSTEKPQSG